MHDTLVDSSPAPITDAPSRRAPQQLAGTIRKKLWRGGLAFAITALIFVIGWEFRMARAADHRLAFGHDLLPSYAAGLLVREGRASAMYDRQIVQGIEAAEIGRSHLDMDPRFGPWLNPPFFAWVFAPLAALPYKQALGAFVFVNLLLLSVSFLLMRRMLFSSARQFSNGPKKENSPRRHGDTEARSKVGIDPVNQPIQSQWKNSGLVPLLLATSMPFMQAFGHQQNTFLTLLILCVTVVLWRRRAGFSAGLVAGLLAFKPQHAVLICGVLILTLGWRALAGVAITGFTFLLITILTMPGCLDGFLHDMPKLVATIQNDAHYNWGRQVTFMSFWRLLIQPDTGGPTWISVRILTCLCSGGVAMALIGACIKWLGAKEKYPSIDPLIGATIAAAPLIMPYYMDYDLVLLVLPTVLLAARWIGQPSSIDRFDRMGLWTWVALFAATYINPGFARQFHFNLTVPALLFVGGYHVLRTFSEINAARPAPAVSVT